MERLTNIIMQATDALPSPEELAADGKQLSARDWAGFFAAIAAFLAQILPLLIPLFTKTKTE